MSPFEVPEGPYHIEEVMAAIRARIIEGGGASGASEAPPAPTTPALIDDGTAAARLRAQLDLARHRQGLDPGYRIHSHRPMLGHLTDLIKGIIHWGSRPYTDAIRERQESFNEAALAALGEAAGQLDALRAQLSETHAIRGGERMTLAREHEAMAQSIERLRDGLLEIEAHLEQFEQSQVALHRDLAARLEQFEQGQVALHRDLAARGEETARRMEQHEGEIGSALKALQEHGTRIADLARESNALGDAARGQAARHDLGPFFRDVPPELRLAAVDLTRGTEEDISARQSIYIDLFRGLPGQVLDVGCGRGELLRHLRLAGIECWGAEVDPLMIEITRRHGVHTVRMDALSALRSVQPGTLGGLFAAQVVEHLFPGELLEFLRLARNRLAPGGSIVIETINAGSLGAIAKSYWRDLDHKQLLHPEYLKLLLEMIGFEQVEFKLLAPFRDDERAPALPPAEVLGIPGATRDALQTRLDRIEELLWGPQDYYVTARQGARTLEIVEGQRSEG